MKKFNETVNQYIGEAKTVDYNDHRYTEVNKNYGVKGLNVQNLGTFYLVQVKAISYLYDSEKKARKAIDTGVYDKEAFVIFDENY